MGKNLVIMRSCSRREKLIIQKGDELMVIGFVTFLCFYLRINIGVILCTFGLVVIVFRAISIRKG